tara:strand:- start:2421 stop:2603 length:183 start_codon:yes stop_codon:yes gene_type:complete
MSMNHIEYPKTLKSKTEAQLKYIIWDCKFAMEAMPDNPKNGYYADEIAYCTMELNKRKEA